MAKVTAAIRAAAPSNTSRAIIPNSTQAAIAESTSSKCTPSTQPSAGESSEYPGSQWPCAAYQPVSQVVNPTRPNSALRYVAAARSPAGGEAIRYATVSGIATPSASAQGWAKRCAPRMRRGPNSIAIELEVDIAKARSGRSHELDDSLDRIGSIEPPPVPGTFQL